MTLDSRNNEGPAESGSVSAQDGDSSKAKNVADPQKKKKSRGPSRRTFLAQAGGAAAMTLAGGALVEKPTSAEAVSPLLTFPHTWKAGPARGTRAYNLRVRAARPLILQGVPAHPDNGDERLYTDRIGSFHKCFEQNVLGEVEPDAYDIYLKALRSGKPEDFDAIALAGPNRLHSPQTSLAFQMEALDSHYYVIPPAPTFASAQTAAEVAELYWQALARDVPFSEYATNPITIEACADLSQFSDFRGPKSGGVVIPDLLFRGLTPGDQAGPYVSQFFMPDVPYGSLTMTQQFRAAMPGVDFMTNYDEWLHVQRGGLPNATRVFDPTPRYVHSARNLCEWVHFDFPYQWPLHAALIILLGYGQDALADGNPYKTSVNQTGFATFGPPDIMVVMAQVAKLALNACWFQKWQVHRRLRPEMYAARVHNHLIGYADYPLHPDIMESSALGRVFSANGNYLIPQGYPEGCPPHPAYPSGHASFAGAAATVLKAFFNESFVIPDPVESSPDGLSLVPFNGEPLTIGGELNKMATNIGLGRNFSGIHYRSDIVEGLKLGEQVAIRLLTELKPTYNERFPGFTLTKFDGTTITI